METTQALSGFLERRADLLGFLRLMLPADLVEDAFQECFLVVHRRAKDADPQRPLGPWLRGIARNVARRQLERRSRPGHCSDPNLLARLEQAASEHDPDCESAEHLNRCLDQLGERHRALLKRRYGDGLSLAELATESGRSAGAVQVALSRLRTTLRACIDQARGLA